ncbi:MAG: hypothetical protein IH840_03315 [Candidatus Heimdallarchaeota archaeon]|nr:hypothetical protein [Candidatus Heimdallarchaeota archaeon]
MTDLKLKLTEEQITQTMKNFADPVRMYILLEILRLPNITTNELNKKLYISGTKLFYHLNHLSKNDPPLIIESGTEKVTNHISRRKFTIHPEMGRIGQDFYKNLKQFKKTSNLISLYISNAILHQQIREVEKFATEEAVGDESIPQRSKFQQSILDNPVFLMLLDEEYAQEMRRGIREVMNKCSMRYQNMSLTEALRQCTFVSVAGIYPMA